MSFKLRLNFKEFICETPTSPRIELTIRRNRATESLYLLPLRYGGLELPIPDPHAGVVQAKQAIAVFSDNIANPLTVSGMCKPRHCRDEYQNGNSGGDA